MAPADRTRAVVGPQLGPRARRQPALGELVEKRLVADPENAGGLGTIPAHALEHFLQRLALGVSRPASRDLPQTFGCGRSRGRPEGMSLSAGIQGLEHLVAVEYHEAADHVLQLAHVA